MTPDERLSWRTCVLLSALSASAGTLAWHTAFVTAGSSWVALGSSEESRFVRPLAAFFLAAVLVLAAYGAWSRGRAPRPLLVAGAQLLVVVAWSLVLFLAAIRSLPTQ